MSAYLCDYRCGRCNWIATKQADVDAGDDEGPGTIACPECGTGDEIRWWCKRPAAPFVPPASAAQAFGEQPWNYTPTPEQIAERAAREAERPVPQYAAPAPKVVEKEHEQQTLAIADAAEAKS